MAIAEKKKSWLVGLTVILVCALVVGSSVHNRAYAQQKSAMVSITPQDYVEIKQLYSAYAAATDSGSGSATAAVFAPGGKFSSEETKHIPEAIESIAKKMVNEDRVWGWPRHLMVNVLITPTAEGVKGSCYLLLLNSEPNPNVVLIGKTGFYDDILVKTPQGWRFKTRELWMDGEEGSPHNGLH